MMANPLVAEAAVTPSLKNLVNSVIAGGVLLGVIATAVTAVSSFDPIRCVVVGEIVRRRSPLGQIIIHTPADCAAHPPPPLLSLSSDE